MREREPAIQVFYDGDCPVCRREVAWYTRMDRDGRIGWTDINALADAELPRDRSRAELLGRFHVCETSVSRSGEWHVGVDAFGRIWRELPMLRHLAWLFSTPGIRQVAELGYRAFLRWQARDRRRRLAA